MQFPPDHPIFEGAQLMPPKRKESSLLFFVKIVVGGAVGLLAGYGVLTLISGKAPLQSNGPVTSNALVPKASSELRPSVVQHTSAPEANSAEDDSPPPDVQNHDAPPQERFRALPPPAAAAPVVPPMDPIRDGAAVKPLIAQPNQKPRDVTDAKKPSAIVVLAFDKPVIRVVAETDKADTAVCDVGFSHNLLQRGGASPGYEIVAEKMAGGHQTIELAANIKDAGAAIEITVIRRSGAIVCELRPLYSLPSGDIQPLTITRGTKQFNDLTKSLASAQSARRTLPQMRSDASKLKSDLATAQRATSGNGNTPAETGAGRTAATIAAGKLGSQLANADKKVASAERLAAREAEFSADLQKLKEVGEYAKGIASVATVSVRFYSAGVTIPATEK